MKLLTSLLLFSLFIIPNAFGGYNTPGTGVRWNLDDLVANSGGVVTFGSGFYTFNDSVKVTAGDTLYITVDATVKFAANKALMATGFLFIDPPTNVLFTALDTNNRYAGVRIDFNNAIVRNLIMEYAHGGLRIADCSPLIDSCIFRSNNTLTSFQTGTIAVFRSGAIIQNCLFQNNSRSAIQGGGNIGNPVKVYNSIFIGNNLLNINTPQINIGGSGTGDTVKIIGNQFLRASTNSGGIGFLPVGIECNVVISRNKIVNQRYGINLQGGSLISAIVSYNIIDSNNTQNSPNLGGSGIAFAGGAVGSQQNSIVTGNLIRWNLWGITIQNRSRPNLGNLTNADTTDDGKNVFVNNTNSTTPFIDLYNNSLDTIYAQGNYWNTSNLDSVAMKIFDQSDNPALGPVYWTPIAVRAPGSPTAHGSNGRTGSALYYFANSLPEGSPSPSQPEFSWRDTTGSTSLIVNKLNVGTLGAGTVSDGRYDIIGQLGSDAMRLFGINYTDFYIGTNGIIGFNAFSPTGANIEPPATGVPQAGITNAIFPLWMDFDYASVVGPVLNRLSYKVTANEVIITYDNAFVSSGLLTTYVSFQVIIQKSASPTQNSRIIVQYDDAKSGADFIARYNNNTLPAHFVGLQGIFNGTDYLEYRFRTPTTLVASGALFGSPVAVAFGPDASVLPVELASFTSFVNNNNVTLNWQTVNELNNSGFDIERRAEDSTWSKVGNVTGNGTTNESKNYSFSDDNLQSGKYNYRLKQVDYNGNYEYFNLSSEIIVGVPQKFELSQNYPNPFNPVTKINYSLPVDGKVALKIFDVSGREVASLINNEVQNAGYYTVTFNGQNLSSGVYFYRLTSGNFTQTKKLMLIK